MYSEDQIQERSQ